MKVGDEYRKNTLSFTPGGCTVTSIFKCGKSLEYDKVKFPKAYISRIKNRDDIVQILIDGKSVWVYEEGEKYWEK